MRAALAVSGPAARLGRDRVEATFETLARAAGEIAHKLFRDDTGGAESDDTIGVAVTRGQSRAL